MGLILQRQRGGIEDLLEHGNLTPFTVDLSAVNTIRTVDGRVLSVAGVSKGFGTCSREEFHGVDVLVLSEEPRGVSETGNYLGAISLAGVVIERALTETERPPASTINGGVALWAVEGAHSAHLTAEGVLEISGVRDNAVAFYTRLP